MNPQLISGEPSESFAVAERTKTRDTVDRDTFGDGSINLKRYSAVKSKIDSLYQINCKDIFVILGWIGNFYLFCNNEAIELSQFEIHKIVVRLRIAYNQYYSLKFGDAITEFIEYLSRPRFVYVADYCQICRQHGINPIIDYKQT